ncbi:MAG: transglutaminase domain-containing protein [Reyranella sp.]|uniref:transglutaminase domain-containing protein n=1 Tax=Reyranella sp. TaxID=1929291 RepID=UPI003D12A323
MNLDPFRTPIDMTDPGRHARLLDTLPGDAGQLAEIVQGVLLHQHVAPAYGVTLTPAQQLEPHIRGVEPMLERIAAHDARPLTSARPVAERLVGNCRHFSLLHVAMLRRHGVPARARCGFAAYFEKGRFVDHWVTEHWNEAEQRWQQFDAQLDARQRALFKISFDPRDTPRDQFLVAGEAWQLCRAGKADPQAFGILDMHGLWFIAGNVIRDLAALNNHEMLPWDVWGAMRQTDAELDLDFIDRMAVLTCQPDRDPAALQRAYQDARIAVPDTVFNAVLGRPDRIH